VCFDWPLEFQIGYELVDKLFLVSNLHFISEQGVINYTLFEKSSMLLLILPYIHHDLCAEIMWGIVLHRLGGQIIRSAIPITLFLHTGPYVRLSIDDDDKDAFFPSTNSPFS
jgi:hypothetical protein